MIDRSKLAVLAIVVAGGALAAWAAWPDAGGAPLERQPGDGARAGRGAPASEETQRSGVAAPGAGEAEHAEPPPSAPSEIEPAAASAAALDAKLRAVFAEFGEDTLAVVAGRADAAEWLQGFPAARLRAYLFADQDEALQQRLLVIMGTRDSAADREVLAGVMRDGRTPAVRAAAARALARESRDDAHEPKRSIAPGVLQVLADALSAEASSEVAVAILDGVGVSLRADRDAVPDALRRVDWHVRNDHRLPVREAAVRAYIGCTDRPAGYLLGLMEAHPDSPLVPELARQAASLSMDFERRSDLEYSVVLERLTALSQRSDLAGEAKSEVRRATAAVKRRLHMEAQGYR